MKMSKLLFLPISLTAILASGCSGAHSIGHRDIDKKEQEQEDTEPEIFYYLTKIESGKNGTITIDYDFENRKVVAHDLKKETTYEFNNDWKISKITRNFNEDTATKCVINTFGYAASGSLKRETAYIGSESSSNIYEETTYNYVNGVVSDYTYSNINKFSGKYEPYRKCELTFNKNYKHVVQEKYYNYHSSMSDFIEGYVYDFRLEDTKNNTYKVGLYHDPKGWYYPSLEKCYEYDKNVEKQTYFIDGVWDDDANYVRHSYTSYGDVIEYIEGENENGKENKNLQITCEYDENNYIKTTKQYEFDNGQAEEIAKVEYTTNGEGVVITRKSSSFNGGTYTPYDTINYEFIQFDKKLVPLYEDGYNAFYRGFYETFDCDTIKPWASTEYMYYKH